MKISTTQLLAAFALALGTTIGLQAADLPGGGRGRAGLTSRPATTQHTAAEAAEVAALRPAFELLKTADHDYQGHRVKAMAAIATACRLLGTEILPPETHAKLETARAGRGRGGATTTSTQPTTTRGRGEKHATTEPEPQSQSDDQLKQAQAIVQKVKDGIPAGKQPRITERLAEAISEITTALTIK